MFGINDETPLYTPCIAAHSPMSLRNASAMKIANMMIYNSIPPEILLNNNANRRSGEIYCMKLDDIILGSKSFTQQRISLKNRLKKMKKWWENCICFGSWESRLRQVVQTAVFQVLENMDQYSQAPLFIFTCQLCFVRDAGHFTSNTEPGTIILKVPKRYCHEYASFLDYLGPYMISRLFNSYLIFGNPEPLAVIFKNSPHLKSLNLRYNSSNYTFSFLSKYCRKLERFVVTDLFGMLCVTEASLYQTFFGGVDKDQLLDKDNPITRPTLSFPNLSHIDIGKGGMCQEFFCNLSYHQPQILSLTCASSSFSAVYLIQAAHNKEEFVSYDLEDVSLTNYCVVNVTLEDFLKYFPKVKHITLEIDSMSARMIPKYQEKVVELLSVCPPSLSINISFDSISDDDIISILTPIFRERGRKLTALQFFIFRKIPARLPWGFICYCPNLELLSLRLGTDGLITQVNRITGPTLSNLQSLSIRYEDGSSLYQFLDFAEKIIAKSPYITSLELVLLAEASSWILDIAAKDYLSNLNTLVLKMTSPGDIVDVDFYVVLVEAMTLLSRLVLIGVGPEVLFHTKFVFRNTALSVIAGKSDSYVAYQGFSSQCEW